MADNVNQNIVDKTIVDQVQSVRLAEGEAKKLLSEMKDLESEIRSVILQADIGGPVQPSYKVKRLEKVQEDVNKLIDEKFGLIILALYANFNRYATIEAKSIESVFSAVETKPLSKADIKKASSNVLIKDITKDTAATPRAWITGLKNKIKEEVNNIFTFVQADILGIDPDENIVNTLLHRLSSKKATDTQNAGIFSRRNNNLKVLVVTSVLQVTNNTRQMFYKKNASKVEYLIHISVIDSSTSEVCRARSGKLWLASTLKGVGHSLPFEQPPLHPFCRSVIGGLLSGYDQTIENDLNYDAWLKRQDVETQVEVLGKRKREIWLRQGLTQTDLVNQAGRPLTIEQLEAKYNL